MRPPTSFSHTHRMLSSPATSWTTSGMSLRPRGGPANDSGWFPLRPRADVSGCVDFSVAGILEPGECLSVRWPPSLATAQGAPHRQSSLGFVGDHSINQWVGQKAAQMGSSIDSPHQ